LEFRYLLNAGVYDKNEIEESLMHKYNEKINVTLINFFFFLEKIEKYKNIKNLNNNVKIATI
jgi:hypothetical protein